MYDDSVFGSGLRGELNGENVTVTGGSLLFTGGREGKYYLGYVCLMNLSNFFRSSTANYFH